MGKKGGKGKGKKKATPEVVTTRQIVRERERSMAPRLGDACVRSQRADAILKECVLFKVRRAAHKGEKRLDASRSNLAEVPEELSSSDELKKCVEEVDLSRNELFGSERVLSVVAEFDHLRHLDVSRNFLNGPLSAKISRLELLDTLILDANELTALPACVGELTKMRHFSIAHNALKDLPDSVGNWVELEYLNVRSNKLEALPETIGNWVNLKTLYLGANLLQSIPEDVQKLGQLQELDLRSNKLEEVPPGLAGCPKLVKLHLGDNKVGHVPAEVLAALVDLEELHLYKNKLDKLPEEVGSLTKCRRLTLSSNNIKTLPETIGACADLQELYLNNCAKLAAVPASAGALASLTELQAKKCPALKALPASAVGWANLRELDLRTAKKPVCKLPPDLVTALTSNKCVIRGGVTKGGKKGGKKK